LAILQRLKAALRALTAPIEPVDYAASSAAPPAAFRRPVLTPPPKPDTWTVPAEDGYRVYVTYEPENMPAAPNTGLSEVAGRATQIVRTMFGETFRAYLPVYRQLHWWWLQSTTGGHYTHVSGQRLPYSGLDFRYEVYWLKREPVVVIYHTTGEREEKKGQRRVIVVTRAVLPADAFILQHIYTLTPALTSELKAYIVGVE
jgi:hypothetical protein